MTGKNNLSVSEKFWIGILSTIICAIIGIAVSLFVPEVRDFFGIEEVKKSDKNMIESIILSADSVFEQGQYAAAIAKYETIPTYAKQDISDKLEQAKKCLEMKENADKYFKNKEYKQAEIEFQKLIKINPKDVYTKEQISKCEKEIQKQQAEQQKREAEQRMAEQQRQQAEQKKLPEVQQAIPKPTTGRLMIYSKSSYQIDVKIGSEYRGRLNSYFPDGEPYCGQDGTITVELSIGEHRIEITCEGYTHITRRTIKGGDCVSVPLDFSKIIK